MSFNLKCAATTWVRTCFLRAGLRQFKAAVKKNNNKKNQKEQALQHMMSKNNMCPVQTCVTHLLVMSESSLLLCGSCQTNLHWPAMPPVKTANL